jgi:sugar transferase (PEP-CTERM/EpsH1 system associated)
MRILMLAHRLPYPPRTGDKVRAYHVARHLGTHHDLTLACLVDEPGSDAAIEALRQEIPDLVHASLAPARRRASALLGLAMGASATMTYFASPELRTRLAARLHHQFDLVYVSSSSMAQYVTEVGRVPVIMDFVDIDSDKWVQYGARLPLYRAWVYRLEAARLRAWELQAARRANRCVVATRQEATLLHFLAPWAPVTVVPNGVDLEYFNPSPAAAGRGSLLVFTGAMDYFPNADAVVYFCHHIFPKIRAQIPDVQFAIVGKSPGSSVRRLANIPGVQVTGAVPDVRPYLSEAAVAVAPLRVARGIQNKVLEAMAMRLPVVASPKAHEGLDAQPGRHLVVAEDVRAFVEATVRLLRTPALREETGKAARAFVERHHSWTAALGVLDTVVADVMRSTPDTGVVRQA